MELSQDAQNKLDRKRSTEYMLEEIGNIRQLMCIVEQGVSWRGLVTWSKRERYRASVIEAN